MEGQSQVNTATSLSAEEVVLVVDENNNPVGRAKRRDVRQQNLWHRASYIFVYNSKKEFYVQRRSMKKDYCPGYFDLANGGVMGADETNEENAQRELEEEVGITGVELKVLGHCKFEDANNRVWGNIFGVKHDCDVKDMKLQADEVDEILLWSIEEAKKRIADGEKITPDSKLAFLQFLDMGILDQ